MKISILILLLHIQGFITQQNPASQWPEIKVYPEFEVNAQITGFEDVLFIEGKTFVSSQFNVIKVEADIEKIIPFYGPFTIYSGELLINFTNHMTYKYEDLLPNCEYKEQNFTGDRKVSTMIQSIFYEGGITKYNGLTIQQCDQQEYQHEFKFPLTIDWHTHNVTMWFSPITKQITCASIDIINDNIHLLTVMVTFGENGFVKRNDFKESDFHIKADISTCEKKQDLSFLPKVEQSFLK